MQFQTTPRKIVGGKGTLFHRIRLATGGGLTNTTAVD